MDALFSLRQILWPGSPSSIIILFLISFFLISFFYLFWRVKRIKRRIRSYTWSSSFASMEEDEHLRDYWFEYQKTFLEDGDIFVTEEEASQFFDSETILSRSILLRYWLGVPNLLIGMGILGTFVSLSYSLLHLEIETMDLIMSGMEVFFSSFLIAISISIWGILLSILFTILEKRLFHSFFLWVDKLCQRLNEVYRVTHWFLVKQAEERQQEMLKELFAPLINKERESSTVIRSAFTDLLAETTKQNIELKQFFSSLAQGMDLSNETILSLGKSISELFSGSMESSAHPILAKIEEYEQLAVDTLDRMVDRIESSISVAFRDLASMLERAEGRTEEFQRASLIKPEDLERIISMLEGALLEASAQQRSEIEPLLEAQEAMGASMKEMAGAIAEQANADQLDRFQDSLGQVEALFESIGGFVVSMGESAKELKSVSALLKQGADSLSQEMGPFLQEKRATLLQLERDLSLSRDLVKEHGENLAVMQGGLSSVFQEIDEGLKDYSGAVRASLNQYLKELSTNLEVAVTGLTCSMKDFRELLEERAEERDNGG